MLTSFGAPNDSHVNYTNMFQQGLHKGGSSAIDRLSNYYIERAEQMQPVVQISSGQNITIFFTKGTKMGHTNAQDAMERDRQRAQQEYMMEYSASHPRPHKNEAWAGLTAV